MSKALVKTSQGSGTGVVPGVASLILPGVGQFINGESDKGLGMLAVAIVSGLGFLGVIPFIGTAAAVVHIATRVYAGADAYVQGRKKR